MVPVLRRHFFETFGLRAIWGAVSLRMHFRQTLLHTFPMRNVHFSRLELQPLNAFKTKFRSDFVNYELVQERLKTQHQTIITEDISTTSVILIEQ